MLPSARCDCGQPWEAHELRCPRPKHRGVGKVIALAVAGGLLLQVVFVAALVVVVAGIPRPTSTPLRFHALRLPTASAGPVQPRMRACELFYAWKKTHRASLLNEAVADAHSSQIPWKFAPRFRTDMTGLRDSVRKSVHSPTVISFEHAVQHHCKLITGGTPRHWAQVRSAVAQFSRPGYAKGPSTGQVPESGLSWNAPAMTH
jgi:hypothetical protein